MGACVGLPDTGDHRQSDRTQPGTPSGISTSSSANRAVGAGSTDPPGRANQADPLRPYPSSTLGPNQVSEESDPVAARAPPRPRPSGPRRTQDRRNREGNHETSGNLKELRAQRRTIPADVENLIEDSPVQGIRERSQAWTVTPPRKSCSPSASATISTQPRTWRL